MCVRGLGHGSARLSRGFFAGSWHPSGCLVPFLVARAAPDNSRGENAVSDVAMLGVFHVDNTLLEGDDLRVISQRSTLCWGISSDVHHGRLKVVQQKESSVAKKICIVQLHLLSQSV